MNKQLTELVGTLLTDTSLPVVLRDLADAFEAHGVHLQAAAIRVGDPTPAVVNRIRQEDVAGAAFAGLGNRLGAWLTLQSKPKARRRREP